MAIHGISELYVCRCTRLQMLRHAAHLILNVEFRLFCSAISVAVLNNLHTTKRERHIILLRCWCWCLFRDSINIGSSSHKILRILFDRYHSIDQYIPCRMLFRVHCATTVIVSPTSFRDNYIHFGCIWWIWILQRKPQSVTANCYEITWLDNID